MYDVLSTPNFPCYVFPMPAMGKDSIKGDVEIQDMCVKEELKMLTISEETLSEKNNKRRV